MHFLMTSLLLWLILIFAPNLFLAHSTFNSKGFNSVLIYGQTKKEECKKEFEEAKELLEKQNWQMELEKWKMEYLEKRREKMEMDQKGMMERIGQFEHCETMALASKLGEKMVDVLKMEAQIWKEMAAKLNWEEQWQSKEEWKRTAILFICLFALALLTAGVLGSFLLRERIYK